MRDESDDDKKLFRKYFGNIKRLRVDKTRPAASPPKPRARFSRADEQSVLEESISGESFAVETGEELGFRRDSVREPVFRKLKRGHYSVEREIDLHGLTYDEAALALEQFVSSSLDQGLHCVRIVHGKGLRSGAAGPVIKPLVDQWLRGCSGVLAFASARPADGGTGADNVLLKTGK